ncbi:MAG: dihydroneopterin aldolase [Candidatus Azobacteroides sp.]|nr:dihydroneopterin aldolase [Candidatus Azobacteroides sp.]
MQYIELKEMNFYAYHGVMEQERKVGNTYTVDLKIYFDFREAMRTDNLNDTIHYAFVYEIIKQEMTIPSHLIEHVAGRILQRLHNDFPQIQSIEIRLAKKNPPFGGDIRETAVGIITDYSAVYPKSSGGQI